MMSGMKETQLLCADNLDRLSGSIIIIDAKVRTAQSHQIIGYYIVGMALRESGYYNYSMSLSIPYFLVIWDAIDQRKTSHNCLTTKRLDETAAVSCLRKGTLSCNIMICSYIILSIDVSYWLYVCMLAGVRLEFGPNEQRNNSITTVDNIGEGERALLCTIDKKPCCVNEANTHGNWFLPDGSQINSTQTLYVTSGNQTMGLNRINNNSILEIPSGI